MDKILKKDEARVQYFFIKNQIFDPICVLKSKFFHCNATISIQFHYITTMTFSNADNG